MMRNLIIVKFGGSVITDKTKFKAVRINVLENISKELSEALKLGIHKIIIVHGGGSFGHPLAYKYKLTEGIINLDSLMGISETIDSMRELSLNITRSLRKFGIPVFPIQTSSISLLEKDKITTFFQEALKVALEKDLIPLLWGDVALDLSKGCSILSGDEIIRYLVFSLRPSKVIFGTDVDGIFLDFPKNLKLVRRINEHNLESVIKAIKPVDYTDVTGGFYKKMQVMIEIAKFGVRVQIINLLKHGNLIKAIMETEDVGTIIEL